MNKNRVYKIAVMTSGGESSVYDYTAADIAKQFLGREDYEVYFIYEGFRGATRGFEKGGIKKISLSDIEGMENSRGGQVLKGCRGYNSFNFKGDKSDETAKNLSYFDVVFIVGGDGSMRHASEYIAKTKNSEHPLGFVGLVGTMDGAALTYMTLGEPTAAYEILREVEASHASAISMSRYSVVEGMGRDCGEPVADAGLLYLNKGGNVAAVITPQVTYEICCIAEAVLRTNGGVVIVSEGLDMIVKEEKEKKAGYHPILSGAAQYIAKELKSVLNVPENRSDELSVVDVKATVTGYAQRAGKAVEEDRKNADLHVAKAIEYFDQGERNFVIVDTKGRLEAMRIVDFVSANKLASDTKSINYHPKLREVLETLRDRGVYVGEFK